MDIFNSPSLEYIMRSLDPRKSDSGDRHWPPKIKSGDVKFRSGTDLRAWYNGIIEQYPDISPLIEICNNMAVIITIRWTRRKVLEYINIQCLVVCGDDLEGFRNKHNSTMKCDYLRLDLDRRKPGKLFKEPILHLHCNQNKEPRISFLLQKKSNNVIVEFFDFIFRNYNYDAWEEWLRKCIQEKNIRPEENYYEIISEAYKTGQLHILEEEHYKFKSLKEKWMQDEKNRFFDLMPPTYA